MFLDVATPLSDSYRSSTALTPAISSTASPAGLIHNTYCTTPNNQNFISSLTSPKQQQQTSLFGSTTTTTSPANGSVGGGGDADWRREELQNTSKTITTKTTPFW